MYACSHFVFGAPVVLCCKERLVSPAVHEVHCRVLCSARFVFCAVGTDVHWPPRCDRHAHSPFLHPPVPHNRPVIPVRVHFVSEPVARAQQACQGPESSSTTHASRLSCGVHARVPDRPCLARAALPAFVDLCLVLCAMWSRQYWAKSSAPLHAVQPRAVSDGRLSEPRGRPRCPHRASCVSVCIVK